MSLKVKANTSREGWTEAMYVRAEEQSPLSLEDKQQPIREEALNATMHRPSIDKARAVKQGCPIG